MYNFCYRNEESYCDGTGPRGFHQSTKASRKSPNDPKLFLGVENEEKLLSSLSEETAKNIVTRFKKSNTEKINITYKYQCKIQSENRDQTLLTHQEKKKSRSTEVSSRKAK